MTILDSETQFVSIIVLLQLPWVRYNFGQKSISSKEKRSFLYSKHILQTQAPLTNLIEIGTGIELGNTKCILHEKMPRKTTPSKAAIAV